MQNSDVVVWVIYMGEVLVAHSEAMLVSLAFIGRRIVVSVKLTAVILFFWLGL